MAQRANAYGLLRLILAALVVVGHAYLLAGAGPDPLARLVDGRADLQGAAVAGFFGLSGYLLVPSVLGRTGASYVRRRAARILPGFWVALGLTALVAGPLAYALADRRGYPWVGADSALSYVAGNAGLLITQPTIGDATAGLPLAGFLNGSLWSLLPEALCYAVLLGGALLVDRDGRRLMLPAAVGAVALLGAHAWVGGTESASLAGWASGPFLAVTGSFALGVAAAGAVARGVGLRTIALAGAVLVALATLTLWPGLGDAGAVLLLIGVGGLVRRGPATRLEGRADVSYGVYLLAYPVQQLLVIALDGPPLAQAALALAVALPVALALRILVELPAQRRLVRGRAA